MPLEREEERNNRISNEEWKAWTELCQHMKDIGAVTQEDCNSPSKHIALTKTDGQKLFALIRMWGIKFAMLVK